MKNLFILVLIVLGGSIPLHSSPLTLHRYPATQMLGDSATPQLLLSELADPSDTWQARFVEIYNPGQDTVDFSEETWYLSKQSNGGSTWGDILLTGNIPPGECHVVAYSTSAFNTAYGFDPDQSSGNINGNGDDGYFLFHGGDHVSGSLVDAYGVIDQDGTGEPWEYLDTKVTRNYDSISPSAIWDSLGWTIHLSAGTPAMTPSCHRDTVTWNGSVDDNWDNGSNWTFPVTLGFIPDASDNILVPAGLSSYPGITSEAYCHDILLQANNSSNASLLGIEYLTVNGTGSMQRFISGGTNTKDDPDAIYHLSGSPVDSIHAIDVFPGSAYVREWDEINQEWINLSANDLLLTGRGYSTWLADGDTIVTFSGDFNDVDISPALTYTTGGTINPDYDGYNLVSNPYPSGLDWDVGSWVKSDLDASMAIWDGNAGNYLYWNETVGGISDGIIPPCQGFFVRANDQSPVLTIPLDACVHSSLALYAPVHLNERTLVLSVAGGDFDYRDETYIAFNEICTPGIDTQWDAIKLNGLGNAPQLYSRSDNHKLAINYLPLDHISNVPIYFSNGYEGEFSLLAEGLESFGPQTEILLNDLKLGTQHQLRQHPGYSFYYDVNDDPERFMLTFSGLTGTHDEIYNPGIEVYSRDHNICVDNPECQGDIFVYNILGQLIVSHTITSDHTAISVPAGSLYILKISMPAYKSIHKIFIQ